MLLQLNLCFTKIKSLLRLLMATLATEEDAIAAVAVCPKCHLRVARLVYPSFLGFKSDCIVSLIQKLKSLCGYHRVGSDAWLREHLPDLHGYLVKDLHIITLV